MASESINSPFGRYWLRPHSGSRNNCEIFCLAHWNCISVSVHVIFYFEVLLAFMFIFETENRIKLAVYKSGTGTRGRGHKDACVGTWDLGTQDGGLGDARQRTWGHQVWDAGTSNTGTQGTRDVNDYRKVGGKCDISFFLKMCCLWFHLPKPHRTPYDVYPNISL